MNEYILHLTETVLGRIPARSVPVKYDHLVSFLDACENVEFRDYYFKSAEFVMHEFKAMLVYIFMFSSVEFFKYVVSYMSTDSLIHVTYYYRRKLVIVRDRRASIYYDVVFYKNIGANPENIDLEKLVDKLLLNIGSNIIFSVDTTI